MIDFSANSGQGPSEGGAFFFYQIVGKLSGLCGGQAVSARYDQGMRLKLFKNLNILDTTKQRPSGKIQCELQKAQALLVGNDKILWRGPRQKINSKRIAQIVASQPKSKMIKIEVKEIDLAGRTLLPGFVECHTHSIFAGSRAEEFEWRNAGLSYLEINRRGGGIHSTVASVRASSEIFLLQKTQERVTQFLRQGVTTLEVKSGYGLDQKSELKMLRIAKELRGPKIVPTFLGLHSIPKNKEKAAHLRDMIHKVLPQIAREKLARRCDIFVDKNFFDLDDSRVLLFECQELGFDLVIHADQIVRTGASLWGFQNGAISCEHMIQVTDADLLKMKSFDSVAVLLPTADLYMKCAYPPARKMLDLGMTVALATDFNPGTAPSQDLALVGVLARIEMKMTLPEVIYAYTQAAAKALGLQSAIGQIAVGFAADFVVIESDWRELFYSVGHLPIGQVYRGGRRLV